MLFAWRARRRNLKITPAARSALTGYAGPGNVDELARVVRSAATRTDVIDIGHLPPEIFAKSGQHLPPIKAFEQDEIVRALTRTGTSVKSAAVELGMSQAAFYRKLSQYHIRRPRGPLIPRSVTELYR